MINAGEFKDLTLQHWFPTTVGVVDCPFMDEIQSQYLKYIKFFQYDKVGFCYAEQHKNERFKKLNEWINEQVNQYAKLHKFPGVYGPGESWIIDYQNHKGQPWHTHIGWTISTVFYLVADKTDKGTKFRSPTYNDTINPLRISPIDDRQGDKYTTLTYPTCEYAPVEGRLLIFRSYLEHSMDIKDNNDRRVIFSYNFNPVNV